MKRILFTMLAMMLVLGLAIPAAVVTAQDTTKTIHVRPQTLRDVQGNCPYITEWHFIINQIDENESAPASITVYWDNGSSAVVPLDKLTPGKWGVAHYNTTENAGNRVTDATAEIYADWGGKFNLSSAECSQCTGCLEITKQLSIPSGAPLDLLDGTFVINVAGPSGYSVDVSFEMEDGEIVSTNPATLCNLVPGTYTISEGEMPADWGAPDLPVDVEVSCGEPPATVTVTNTYMGPLESLEAHKTVVTSYNRTHRWSIAKSVDTQNGYREDEYPKIWLYADGSGDETATWTIDVTYEGYEDSNFNVSGTITIENTGDLAAVITGIEDLLGSENITDQIDWGGIEFPYTLEVGEILVGTYSVDVGSKITGYNAVNVTTEIQVYPADPVEIVWGDPTTEVNKTVSVVDTSDLFGEVILGTLDADDYEPGEVILFTYDEDFAWEDYGADDCGEYTYENTAEVIGDNEVVLDSDDATLKVNVQCYIYETAYAKAAVNSTCFIPTFSNWGWTNRILPGTYTWELWAAAGQCDTSKGIKVGTVTVVYNGGGYVTVTYNVASPYSLQSTSVYAGTTQFPRMRVGRRWVNTVAPGQYYNASPFTNGTTVWVIAHAKVGIPDPYFGP